MSAQDYAYVGALVVYIVLAWIAIEVLSRTVRWTWRAVDDRAARREASEDDRLR